MQNSENTFWDIEDVEFELFSSWYVKQCFLVDIMKREEYFEQINYLRQWDCDMIFINLN